MKFNNEDRVFIKPLGCKGVIKEQNQEFSKPYQYKCTYFVGEERKVEWFKEDELDIFKKSKQLDQVKFAKVKPDAKIPTKRFEDGCYDIYACFEEDEFILLPNKPTLVSTGIASAFSNKYRFNCKRERGSTGVVGMSVLSGQIDSGYRGEWFINICNLLNKPIVISKLVNKTEDKEDFLVYPASKGICQTALEFVPNVQTVEIPYDELKNIPSERGMGKLGDSGK